MKPSEITPKMKGLSDNFVTVSQEDSDECSCSEKNASESIDPLSELDNEISEPKCYRIESVVFAEPLNNISNRSITKDKIEDQTEYSNISSTDDIIVQKRIGKKYKKYLINIVDESKICPLPECARSFSSTTLLKAHIRKVHCADRSKYICDKCGAGFCAQYLLVRHTAVHRGNRVTCYICSKQLSERTSLSSHLRSHSGARPHTCSICSKGFSRASTLATHMKFVHKKGPLGCDQCELRFTSRKQWSQHMTNHRRKKPEGDASQES